MPRRTLAVLTLALASAAGTTSAQAAPPSTAFTYQGELKQDGQPVTGSLPMQFRLYNAATGGSPLAQVTKNTVALDNGRFTEPLSFPISALNSSQALWLEVVVNGTTLPERQQITGSAYSLSTRGITVDASNNVGIGTTTPQRKLSVSGGVDIYDSSNQGIDLSSHALRFSDANEDVFYRFVGAQQKHIWGANGTDLVSLDGSGRLGIGTMNPTAALEVVAPAGDASVKLPPGSIGPAELAASPGIASVRSGLMQSITGGPGAATVIATRTITAPASGYLVAHGTGIVTPSSEALYMQITLNGVDQGAFDMIPGSGVSLDRMSPAILRVIPVPAGTHTLQWTAATLGGTPTINKSNFLVMYFPTAHGEVIP